MSITGNTLLKKPIIKEFLKKHIEKWLTLTQECVLEFREKAENALTIGCKHCGWCFVSIGDDEMSVHTATYGMSRGEIGIAIARICEDILVEELGSGSLYSIMQPDIEWIFDGKKWKKKVDLHFWENLEKENSQKQEKDSTQKPQL